MEKELKLTKYDFSRAADATLRWFYNSLDIFEKDETLDIGERFFANLAKKEILKKIKSEPDISDGYRIPNPEWIRDYGGSIVRALLEPCCGVRINSTFVNSEELFKEEFEKFKKNNKADIASCIDELVEGIAQSQQMERQQQQINQSVNVNNFTQFPEQLFVNNVNSPQSPTVEPPITVNSQPPIISTVEAITAAEATASGALNVTIQDSALDITKRVISNKKIKDEFYDRLKSIIEHVDSALNKEYNYVLEGHMGNFLLTSEDGTVFVKGYRKNNKTKGGINYTLDITQTGGDK